ncbi:MAG: PQQ-dependent sugar dehydrogenase [Exilibacterium sp.]
MKYLLGVCVLLLGASRIGWCEVLSQKPILKGESAGMKYQVEEVAKGLGVPWGLAFLDDTRILFTIREGKLGLLQPETGEITAVSGAPVVKTGGQGGLLDVAVADGYRKGDWIYLTYCKAIEEGVVTTLARAKLEQNRLTQMQDLLVTRSATDTGRHFGSRIAFDGEGHVFFTVGERGVRPNAQDLSVHAGSVLRLNLDGSVPADNPFVGNKQALPEIWSYGHRNPQGITYDPVSKRLWEIEHGPRGGDEINLILPGRNYGWPVVSHGKEYWGPKAVGEATSKPGMEAAIKVYIPSIAPSSLMLYSGKAFPAWKGNLFAGALALQHLNRIVLDANGKAQSEQRLLEDLHERIRALVESPEGWLYLSTDSGRILRIRPLQKGGGGK